MCDNFNIFYLILDMSDVVKRKGKPLLADTSCKSGSQ